MLSKYLVPTRCGSGSYPSSKAYRHLTACDRKIPRALRTHDGTIVEGVADLAFRKIDRWVVVDFKTNQELVSALEHCRRQIAIYSTAVSKAPAAPSEAFVPGVAPSTPTVRQCFTAPLGRHATMALFFVTL